MDHEIAIIDNAITDIRRPVLVFCFKSNCPMFSFFSCSKKHWCRFMLRLLNNFLTWKEATSGANSKQSHGKFRQFQGNTVLWIGNFDSEFGFDIWLLETAQFCLLFITKGWSLLKKFIQGQKDQKGQWRPKKAIKGQNFKKSLI